MKYSMVAVVGLGLLVASAFADEKPAAKGGADEKAAASKAGADLKDVKSKASYGLGVTIGRNLKKQGAELDADLLARGFRDAIADKAVLTDAQIQEALVAFQEELTANRDKGQTEFLTTNKAKPGVKVLPSGLQYKVVKDGTGKLPAETDTVKVHYKGTLIDGSEFDSSYARGEPAQFRVNGVIKGWIEALQLMKVGSKWELTIPAKLAYGANPPPGAKIPPNATLVFEVELLDIVK